ncbi:putative chaperone DNAJ protein [Trypanosoma rangeli]|uniref:Putative chaperone DNAJ protein n=1 Tax=Trypanosoma rangeli TaxID=5698 RepID=A0A422P027_TRYRA|nr:putative chaperone DNAJ protein [Trypanosoma rangeli]RNF11067.1 putative chaperone DNAJ protein [Trypanosoma rangeli]|eukprot:RNF11067.1 putative chaperone DNAJ protein [Trypanosoma rangeli]
MRRTLTTKRSALAVLGLDERVCYSEAEVKAAYRRQVKILHPDAGGSASRFCELHDAYCSLCGGRKSTDATSETCDGSPFYTNAHSQWCSGRYDEGSCGEAFARGASRSSDGDFGVGWDDDGRYANRSTRDFYRPYTSNPFAHGYTDEEVVEAKRRNGWRVAWVVLKHGLLWGGLAYLLFVCWCENRIQRAIEARNGGYVDPAYWEKLKGDERRGYPPMVQLHWTDASNEEFKRAWNNGLEAQRRRGSPFGGGGGYASRSVAVTFQGRPFTATGVRGARTGVWKTAATYESDEHCELDDVESD